MQDKYVADVGDFAKHGLLRFLSGLTDKDTPNQPLRLGMVWYYRHDEHGNNGDGRHIGYLNRTPENLTEYRDCDPELWEELRELLYREARCVHCVEKSEILPKSTVFYNSRLHYTPKAKTALKQEIRGWWLDYAKRITQDADIVCLDPDNGVAPTNRRMFHKDGSKFAYPDDIRAFWERGQSLVIYQHANMDKPVVEQAREIANSLNDALELVETGRRAIPLRFNKGTTRIFFVLAQGEHQELIDDRAIRFFSETPWQEHFSRVQLAG